MDTIIHSDPYHELPLNNEKYAANCTELYLGHKNITHLRGFEGFISLSTLFLNDNRVASTEGLEENFRLRNLFLHNNRMRKIEFGSFQCFPFLHKLTLNNNRLDDLEGALAELSCLRHLFTLDMFDNPLAQEDNYRLRVINALKPLKTLDRRRITDEERAQAKSFSDRMAKLASMSPEQKTKTVAVPLTSAEEAALVLKKQRIADIKSRIQTSILKSRPELEKTWLQIDRRKLGYVTQNQFLRVLNVNRVIDDLSSDEVELLVEVYLKSPPIPALSDTGYIRKRLVSYRKFIYDCAPRNTHIIPAPYRMECAPEVSGTASDLHKYVKTVKKKDREEAAWRRRTALMALEDTTSTQTESIGVEKNNYVCLEIEAHNLEAWIALELGRIIRSIEAEVSGCSTTGTDPIDCKLSRGHVLKVFKRMLLLRYAPEDGGRETVRRIFIAGGFKDADLDAKLSSQYVRSCLGVGKVAQSTPILCVRWRAATTDEVKGIEGETMQHAEEAIERLLRANRVTQEEIDQMTAETKGYGLDVTRLTISPTSPQVDEVREKLGLTGTMKDSTLGSSVFGTSLQSSSASPATLVGSSIFANTAAGIMCPTHSHDYAMGGRDESTAELAPTRSDLYLAPIYPKHQTVTKLFAHKHMTKSCNR